MGIDILLDNSSEPQPIHMYSHSCSSVCPGELVLCSSDMLYTYYSVKDPSFRLDFFTNNNRINVIQNVSLYSRIRFTILSIITDLPLEIDLVPTNASIQTSTIHVHLELGGIQTPWRLSHGSWLCDWLAG